MKLPALRPFTVLLVLASALALPGCAEDRPPPTRDDVIYACGVYNYETCRAFGRCLGWDFTRIQQCVDEENADCDNDLQAESCWENQRDALERCSADVAAETCAEVCNDTFCGDQCLYFCPTE